MYCRQVCKSHPRCGSSNCVQSARFCMISKRRPQQQRALLTDAPTVTPSLPQLQRDEARKDDVDKQQLYLAKAWQFLAGASGGFLFPYLNLYLAQRGLSSAQIGLLAALRTWLSAPVSLTATAASDRLRIHKQLLLGACVASYALRSSLPLLGSTWQLFGVLLLADLVGAPVGVLADSVTLSNCNEAAGESYGKQRQWGSIGYGLASLPAGWLMGSTGLTSAFLVYAMACLPLAAVTSQMRYNYSKAPSATAAAPTADSKTHSAQQQEAESKAAAASGSGGAADICQLLVQPAVLVFLWRCLLMGLGMGFMTNYEFLWLKQLGAPETLMGFAIAVSVVTEVPAFTLQGAVLKHISPEALLNLALTATALRLALYGLLPYAGTPWAVLPVELLHGVTFGLGWGAATASATRLAPPQLAATMQGMFQATYAGVGAGLGGLVGGVLFEHRGGQGLFFTAAAMVAVGGLLGAVADHFVGIMRGTKQQQQPDMKGHGGRAGPKVE